MVRQANPDMSITEITKMLGKTWGQMDDKDKAKYNDQSIQDKARYAKELDQLMTKGFFTNADGVKSTDLKVKKKKNRADTSMSPEKARSGSKKRKANTEPLQEQITKKSPKRVRKE